MKVIYKYPIDKNKSILQLPPNSEILCFQVQDDIPTIWAILENDTDEKDVKREILIFGTGYNFGDYTNLKYIGTTQINMLVLHAFENLNYEY